MRPIRRLPVQLYQTPVRSVPLIGGQGQTTVSPETTSGALITVVQSKVIPNALSGSFSTPTTAGNCVIVAVCAFNNTLTPSVSGVTLGGAAGNFASAVSAVNSATLFVIAAIWADPSCAGGQTAIAVSGSNLSVNASYGIIILEVAGLAAASVVDKTSTGVSNSTLSWSSGTTATTTQAYEFWIGINTTGSGAVQPGLPWAQLEFNSNGIGIGYQIVTATGTATYAGTESPTGTAAAAVATLKGSSATLPVVISSGGLATISVGPQGLGNVWYPASVTVQTTTGVNDFSTCQIFLGPAGIPVTLQATLFPGGIGTASLAIPAMTPGQYLIAQWTGANPGDIATMNVTGTMDSVMPG